MFSAIKTRNSMQGCVLGLNDGGTRVRIGLGPQIEVMLEKCAVFLPFVNGKSPSAEPNKGDYPKYPFHRHQIDVDASFFKVGACPC